MDRERGSSRSYRSFSRGGRGGFRSSAPGRGGGGFYSKRFVICVPLHHFVSHDYDANLLFPSFFSVLFSGAIIVDSRVELSLKNLYRYDLECHTFSVRTELQVFI